MPFAHQDEINLELIEDFFQDFSEAHEKCEHTLIALEPEPDNHDLLNELFRNIHTVKGNLVYVGLKDITPMLQSVEDLLDAIRKGSIHYDALLSDVILLALDRTHTLVEARIHQKAPPMDENFFDHLCQLISRIAEVSSENRPAAIQDALLLMAPELALLQEAESAQPAPPLSTSVMARTDQVSHPTAVAPDLNGVLSRFNVPLDEDLQFFVDISTPIEARSRYWQGRTSRLLGLALAMNQHAGNPIASEQLAAAVILHDLGMAFLPAEMLHGSGSLQALDIERLQSHPQSTYQLLHPMQRWSVAAQGVLQHHERVDGNGYPAKLVGDQISSTAKILSIVDTFEARTHERAHSHMTKRPFIRAILEINSCAGSQFDPYWVDVFNQVARAMRT